MERMSITSSNKCTGCFLCAYSCPVNAITSSNELVESFKFPIIDDTKCVGCKKCLEVCPSNSLIKLDKQIKNYVAQSKDKYLLSISTSGGVISTLAKTIVNLGGVVYGAAFDSRMRVNHIRCITESDCERITGSKYVQSNTEYIYQDILSDLKNEKMVLFIGTPCQCFAVRKAFDNYRNFFCCDFVCNGVGSPLIFNKHIEYLEKKYLCKIDNYIFRPKVKAYLEPYEMFSDSKGKLYRIKSPWKKWGSIYYAGFVMRDSCYNCTYSSSSRAGNITCSDIPVKLMGDNNFKLPFEVSKYGASFISVNSEKGKDLLNFLENEINLMELNDEIYDDNKHLKHKTSTRKEFCDLAQISLEHAKYKYLGFSTKVKSIVIDFIERHRGE